MRTILVIAGMAALAVAQSPPTTKATPNELASTRWFVDAAEVETDPEAATDDASELGLCVDFDAKGNVQIESGGTKFPAAPCTQKAESGQVQVSAQVADAKHGKLQWNATVNKTAMSGQLVWHQADGKKRSYEFSGRKATELEGVQWKLTVTPEKVAEDDEVDPPYAEMLEIRRGLLRIVDTDDSQLYAEPTTFELTTKGTKSTILTGTAPHKNGERWQLDIDGKSLTGSFVERSDGEIVSRYAIRGTRIEKAAAPR